MTEAQFDLITKWQKQTFPQATALSKVHHLFDEVKELIIDVKGESTAARLEFADCFLLLFGAAHAYGMSYEGILNCIDEKMEINRKRNWGKPDENGIVNHIKS